MIGKAVCSPAQRMLAREDQAKLQAAPSQSGGDGR
jgi:hypothetical protein